MKEFAHDNQKYGFSNLPDDVYRVKDKEIAAGEEDGSNLDDAFAARANGDFENRYTIQKSDSTQSGESTDQKTKDLNEHMVDCRKSSLMKSRRPSNL